MSVQPGRYVYPQELEPNPAKWGVCSNSGYDSFGHCPHRTTRIHHLCLGRDCPDEED